MAEAVEGAEQARLAPPTRRSFLRRPSLRRPPGRPSERAVYPGRFLVAYLLLVLLFGAALASVAVFGDRPERASTTADWSTFQPRGTEAQKTQAIARFIGRRYRLPSGAQLVRVLGGPPAAISGGERVPVSEFVIRTTDGSERRTLGAGSAIMYILCGGGQDCALSEEAQSDSSGQIVRRAGLELVLYTMRYAEASPVVVLLPPDAEGNPGGAVLFERKQLETQLDRPLARTLPGRRPPSPTRIGTLEGATIDFLTLSNRYDYAFQGLDGGTARMVLNPAPPMD